MIIGLVIAILIWVSMCLTALIVSFRKYKSKRMVTPRKAMVVGTFLSATVMYVPLCYHAFEGANMITRTIESVLLSIYYAIKLFLVDAEFSFIDETLESASVNFEGVYASFASILMLCAPILTLNLILSFFKNVSSYRRLICRFNRPLHVFSELNDKSLALAKSLTLSDRKNVIVFTDVYEKDEEHSFELTEQAREIGAICFKKDILSVNFRLHSKRRELSFFAIGEDEVENINQSFHIIEQYREREKTKLYVFSTSMDGEMIMAAANKGKVQVRRIKDVRSLIYRTLYDMEKAVIGQRETEERTGERIKPEDRCHDLFTSAGPEEDGVRQIGAVVVGCGLHGTEMVKALSWFCQMDGYRVSVDVFDRDLQAASRFAASCPELMSEAYNGVYVDGEAQYMIRFHTGVNRQTGQRFGLDVGTLEFAKAVQALKKTTYVFVSLGTDEANLVAAVTLRTLFEQIRIHPIIQTIVYNSDKKQALVGMKNHKDQAYDIDFIGDLDTLYSEKVIIDSELENSACQQHCKNYPEESFWAYEYNYRSSTAGALHMLARRACGIPGADKEEKELTPEEKEIIGTLEHRRWNAYMRSEGFIYSGSKDSHSRNDLGKMHHDLVNFAELSEEEKRKDSRVGTL